MVDKPQTLIQIERANELRLLDTVRWQMAQLRLTGRDATSVVLGKAEHNCLDLYADAQGKVIRLFGLEVKIDGDVGVRVG